MMMEKIVRQQFELQERLSQQKCELRNNNKSGILSNTEQKTENCVSTNLDVAVNKKIIGKSHDVEKTENRKLTSRVNFDDNLTHLQNEKGSISRKRIDRVDHTHKLHYTKRKESSRLGQKIHNISYNAPQKISYNEKVKNLSEKDTTNSNKNQPQKTKFRFFFQQKQQLWKQQKENKSKIRKQKEKAHIKRGSRFDEFCRKNNLTILFNEYVSERHLISFQNKLPLPEHWKIRNINQRFAIKKLLITTYGKGKYYKLEIDIKDKFKNLAPIRQTRYQDLLQELKPWRQLQNNLRSKQYYILPNENGPTIGKKEQYEESNETHEIIIEDSFITIEYLQFLTIIINKTNKPEIIEISIKCKDMINKFIMIRDNQDIDKKQDNIISKQLNEKNSINKDLYHAKPLFLEVIRKVPGVNQSQTKFSYKEIASHLTKYIFINKDKFINLNNISIAHVKNDLLGLAFNMDYLHRTQVKTLIWNQLVPIMTTEDKNDPWEPKNRWDDQQEKDTEQEIKMSLDDKIQTLMMQSQALRILCND